MNNKERFDLETRTPPMLDLEALHIFRTVAEQGGITRAAAKLNRVQSNVTTRVKQLEERLGTQLFVRERRRLTLSPEGELLLAYADELLRLSSEAQAAVKSGTPRGIVRIGTLESTAAARLPAILSRYHLAYPQVRIELVTGTTGALIARVLNFDIEAAFVAEPFFARNVESHPAFNEELVLITAKSYPKIKRPADIGRKTIIAFGAGCTYRRCLENWLAKAKLVPDHVMEFNSYHAIVACVASGAGVAMVPRSIIRAVPMGKEVAVHPLPAAVSAVRTSLVWREGHRSIALEAMRKELGRAK
jgi:DNA-binding transcriptional LysR family regulator